MSRPLLRLFLFAILLSALTLSVAAQPTPSSALLVLSKQDHTLAIVDPADIERGGAHSGRRRSARSGRLRRRTHRLRLELRLRHVSYPYRDRSGRPESRRPLSTWAPCAVRTDFDFVADKVWFTAEAAKVIGSYDPATDKIDWIMGTGQNRTHMIYVFPDCEAHPDHQCEFGDGDHSGEDRRPGGYAARPSSRGTSAGSRQACPGGPPPGPPGGDWNETVIPVGRGSEGFDVSPDGKEAWVANAGDGTISVIDIDAKKVTATLAANARGANRLKFTPDGKLVLISAGPELVIFDVATQKEVKRLTIGHGSGGVLNAARWSACLCRLLPATVMSRSSI